MSIQHAGSALSPQVQLTQGLLTFYDCGPLKPSQGNTYQALIKDLFEKETMIFNLCCLCLLLLNSYPEAISYPTSMIL